MWNRTDEPENIETIFVWGAYTGSIRPYLIRNSDGNLRTFLAIYETDGTIRVMSLFSWLAPPRATYVFENPNSIIYITNQVATQDEPLIARFDKDTQTWRSFLFENFKRENFCSAQVDEEGYIWLEFGCLGPYSRDLFWQDRLYRLSPDIFDDYQSPNIP
jgi:hypothetical protein